MASTAMLSFPNPGMRITCSRMEPWAIGQMPRAPQTCEVPGPGFYVDRSLQRAICNPNTGEFAPAGKLRTCCALNTVSVATRFGEIGSHFCSSITGALLLLFCELAVLEHPECQALCDSCLTAARGHAQRTRSCMFCRRVFLRLLDTAD